MVCLRDLPPEERGPVADAMRRTSRFTYAQRRVQKIVDGLPPLTAEQRRALARILVGPSEEDGGP